MMGKLLYRHTSAEGIETAELTESVMVLDESVRLWTASLDTAEPSLQHEIPDEWIPRPSDGCEIVFKNVIKGKQNWNGGITKYEPGQWHDTYDFALVARCKLYNGSLYQVWAPQAKDDGPARFQIANGGAVTVEQNRETTMTDRIKTLTVLLDEPMRDDDVQSLVDAIRMMRNVKAVTTHIDGGADEWAEMQVKFGLRDKVLSAVQAVFRDDIHKS